MAPRGPRHRAAYSRSVAEKELTALARLWRVDWELMRKIAVIGAPISIALMLEWGLFSSAALLMGVISTTALAAHQIAITIPSLTFMIPLGIGLAATVRVGLAEV